MDTLEIAYKILYSLETRRNADYMGKVIGPDALGVDQYKWLEVLQTLVDEGYVSGVSVRNTVLGETTVDVSRARISLRGAQYLQENSAMRKFAKVATNVITLIKP